MEWCRGSIFLSKGKKICLRQIQAAGPIIWHQVFDRNVSGPQLSSPVTSHMTKLFPLKVGYWIKVKLLILYTRRIKVTLRKLDKRRALSLLVPKFF